MLSKPNKQIGRHKRKQIWLKEPKQQIRRDKIKQTKQTCMEPTKE